MQQYEFCEKAKVLYLSTSLKAPHYLTIPEINEIDQPIIAANHHLNMHRDVETYIKKI